MFYGSLQNHFQAREHDFFGNPFFPGNAVREINICPPSGKLFIASITLGGVVGNKKKLSYIEYNAFQSFAYLLFPVCFDLVIGNILTKKKKNFKKNTDIVGFLGNKRTREKKKKV